MNGPQGASPEAIPPHKDYHSLYVTTRASHERTMQELRQRELELAVSDSRLAEVERERDDAIAQLEESDARARRNDQVATSVITKLSSRVSELERERVRHADDLAALRTRAAADAATKESLTEQVASLSKALDAATAAAAAVETEAGLANKLQDELRAERTARQDAETLVTAFKAKASQSGADRRSVADAERVAIETIERFHVVEASLAAERDVSSRLRRELHAESERRAKLDDENRTLRARCDRIESELESQTRMVDSQRMTIQNLESEVAKFCVRDARRDDRHSAIFRTIGNLARDAAVAMGISIPTITTRTTPNSLRGGAGAAAETRDTGSATTDATTEDGVVGNDVEDGADIAVSTLQTIATVAAETARQRASQAELLWTRCVAAERQSAELQRECESLRASSDRHHRAAKEASQIAKQRDRDLKSIAQKFETHVAETAAASTELHKRCDVAEGKATAREKRIQSLLRQLQLRTECVGRLCTRAHELVRLVTPALPRFELPGATWEIVERAAADCLSRAEDVVARLLAQIVATEQERDQLQARLRDQHEQLSTSLSNSQQRAYVDAQHTRERQELLAQIQELSEREASVRSDFDKRIEDAETRVREETERAARATDELVRATARVSEAMATSSATSMALRRCCNALVRCRAAKATAVELSRRSMYELDVARDLIDSALRRNQGSGSGGDVANRHSSLACKFRAAVLAVVTTQRLRTLCQAARTTVADGPLSSDAVEALAALARSDALHRGGSTPAGQGPGQASALGRLGHTYVNRVLRIVGASDVTSTGGGGGVESSVLRRLRRQPRVGSERPLGGALQELLTTFASLSESSGTHAGTSIGVRKVDAEEQIDSDVTRINSVGHDTTVNRLETELAVVRSVLADRDRERDALRADIATARLETAAATRTSVAAEQRVSTLAAEAETLRDERNRLRKMCDELRTEIEHAGRRLVDVAMEREVALSELTAVRAELERCNAELQALTRGLGEVDEYIAQPAVSIGSDKSHRPLQWASVPSQSPVTKREHSATGVMLQSTPRPLAQPLSSSSSSSPGSSLARSMLESLR